MAGILGIAPEAVLTSCTHVHTGPSALTGTDAIGWPVPDGLHGRLVDRTTDAARGAVAAPLAATRARFVRTPLPDDVAINRRGHALASSAAILILDGVAIVANFGIHPTVTGPSNLAGRDGLGWSVPRRGRSATPVSPRASSRAAKAT